MGVVEGTPILSDNDWEQVERGGDKAIQAWIDEQMKGAPCAVVLIGSQTAGRRWVKYEIKKAWHAGKGVLGVYIHNLKDQGDKQATKGANPFDQFTLKLSGTTLSAVAQAYNPPYSDSQAVYNYIKNNLESWVEDAIKTRPKYGELA